MSDYDEEMSKLSLLSRIGGGYLLGWRGGELKEEALLRQPIVVACAWEAGRMLRTWCIDIPRTLFWLIKEIVSAVASIIIVIVLTLFSPVVIPAIILAKRRQVLASPCPGCIPGIEGSCPHPTECVRICTHITDRAMPSEVELDVLFDLHQKEDNRMN